ncbi:Abi-alpha family protein [Burkholderia pseudomallei]|uniref:Abi-alpha family protein n=1 Tax=Burkholderia pseudomallei TaxID=28450 RepID=UPI002932E3C0|nr:Abi-alpha family protein [Burkholderia pseudomallei]MDV2086343.1 Abi-alpha family protein [Burkholderia pseudomallei]
MDDQDLLKMIPAKVVENVYSDAVSGALKEAGKIGIDFVKTIRLMLFPVQYAAALQDRLARHISDSIGRVLEDKRIEPIESITLQIIDRLKFQEDGSPITELYLNLLARAMDKERVGEAHPAFVQIISQLAPDEALLIEQIASTSFSVYLRPPQQGYEIFDAKARAQVILDADMSDEQKTRLRSIAVRPEELAQPDLLYTYIEHLVSLGVVAYTNEPRREFQPKKPTNFDFWFLELSGMGRLFRLACFSEEVAPTEV